jgi:hypothetical protein
MFHFSLRQEFSSLTPERSIQVSKSVVLDTQESGISGRGRLLIQSFTGAGSPDLLNEK